MDQFALGANECLAITKTSTKLKILGISNEIEVPGGEIVKVLRLASLGSCFIKLYSSENRNLMLSDDTYACDHNAIKILSEKFGSMLITIGDKVKRLMICNNSDYERFLLNLKLNDVVKVNKFLFKLDHHVVCTVKYIGTVPEIGPGTYIGCKMYDQTVKLNENHKLVRKYFKCNETNGFIRHCGCFFTRTTLLDQSIDNLMNIAKTTKTKSKKKANKSEPVKNVIEPKRSTFVYPETKTTPTSLDKLDPCLVIIRKQNALKLEISENNQNQTIEPIKLTFSDSTYAQKTTNNLNLITPVSRDPYTNEQLTIVKNSKPQVKVNHSAVALQQNINKKLYSSLEPRMISKSPIDPRQQHITDTIIRPKENLPMCSRSNFADRLYGLNPGGSEKFTITHSIQEGPKSTAKRTIFEKKVIHTFSGDKKKKCVIM